MNCPACGEPLYGWVKLDDRSTGASYVVDRCEECGLGVTRGVPEPDAVFVSARRGLRSGATIEMRLPNRASWQAGIGGDRWAALALPTQRLHVTPRSLALLLHRHGLAAVRTRQPALGRNQVWMWQTLLNGFTFNANFARDVVRRRLRPRTARGWPSFAIDAVVTVLAALPLAVIAIPLELLAVALRRGGELVVSVSDAEPAAAPLYDRSRGS
ncbi:MAG TPA: hypothetical protein VK920_06430 [Solirubrobacterales bacterium]|nr:hypothetical protein [Solirubrobacterales bacterium]